MLRTVAVRLCCALLVFLGAVAAYTQNPPPQRPFAAQKLKDDLYMITGGGGNVAAYITSEGVILIDDMYDRDYQGVMAQVKALTNQPVRYVVNTHHHDDHAGANASMPTAVQLISHRNARAQMIRINQPGKPNLTFASELDLNLGGKEVRAYHFGRGHTNGDIIIHFPQARVIHTGDIFLTRPALPYMDFAAGGSAIEWTRVLDETAKLDFDTIIPGHGPISDRAGLAKWRADFVTMRDRIGSMARKGESKEAISRVLLDEFKWPAGGLAIGQVDAFITEMKSAR
jgi:glyoxylase-like metal-dependent hydrolase (beta-lactamase superfamily II)